MALPQEKRYTIADIYALREGERAELIDGQIYYMAPPARKYRGLYRKIKPQKTQMKFLALRFANFNTVTYYSVIFSHIQ